MKTFQIRLNRANPWDSQILAFLETVPPYYRSRALKEAVLAYLQLPGPPGPSAASYAREQLQDQDTSSVTGRNGPVEGSDR